MAVMTSDGILYSKVLVILFMFVNALITTNMLIALMLEDYHFLSHNARPLYLRWALSIEPYWASHPTHGFLTFKFGPLVPLSLLISPFLFFKSRRLNKFMEVFLYIGPLILMTFLFLVTDILCFFWRAYLILTRKQVPSIRETLNLQSSKLKSRCGRCCSMSLPSPCILAGDVARFMKDAFSDPLDYSLPPN